MIANARMYAVSPEVGSLWGGLFSSIIAGTNLRVELLEHPAPAPLDDLWRRSDMGAVFMCGLPFSRAAPQPVLVAAPVPSPAAFGGEACYWSEFVVRRESAFGSVADTFGARIAFTVPDSQSGCIAALTHFAPLAARASGPTPLFAEIVAPTITPLGALQAVIHGAAEIAPIDSYAFSLLEAYRPDLIARVRVVGRTEPTPIPPLVASPEPAAEADTAESVARLSSAFAVAHSTPAARPLMEQLLLQRFVRPDPASYALLQERYAAATEFWRSRALAAVTHAAFTW